MSYDKTNSNYFLNIVEYYYSNLFGQNFNENTKPTTLTKDASASFVTLFLYASLEQISKLPVSPIHQLLCTF